MVVPMLAACGLKVAKMSGRGLGFTGGTLDKLESIPGFNTSLTIEQLISQVNEIGAAIAGQTKDIVPADKKMYALRDVTATVDSIPLIAASIMSKKIACCGDVILLDVKVGSGAFAKSLDEARRLAKLMISIGQSFGRTVGALITDMNQPLGSGVGNSLEVAEAIETLRGGGPADLRALCVELCAEILDLSIVCARSAGARTRAEAAIDSGAALGVFRAIVAAQGGGGRVVDDISLLPQAAAAFEVRAEASGVVSAMDCAQIGAAASVLGAGREHREDVIDPAVGVMVLKKLGDHVEKGEVLAIVHANEMSRVPRAASMILGSYHIGESAEVPPLIHETIR